MARGASANRAKAKRRLLKVLFPEREVIVRTGPHGRHFRLSTGLQATVCFTLLVLLAWNTMVTFGYLERDEEVAVRDVEHRALQESYNTALNEIDDIRNMFTAISREIETSQANLIALAERQNNLRKLDKAARPRSGEELASLSALPSDPLGTIERDHTDLQQRIAALDQLLSRLRGNNADLIKRSAEATGQRISEVERVLARTGLDPDRLIGRFGRGGPFVPFGRQPVPEQGQASPDMSLAALHAKFSRWEQLEAVIKRLPLATPLSEYEITSGFGARHDPINQLSGIHEGIDLGAPQGTPVQATGQGKVVHAGWRDRYGMLVEIDHGHGITTRYGHLSRILVRQGQSVDATTRIGLVGTTGRSSGPHLHYEVRVDEAPRDPLKFITAGNYVYTRK